MIIDVNVDVTSHLGALAKAGVTDVIGYLNPHGTTSKVITPQRAKAIAAAGMTLALVSEGWGDFAHGDISAAKGKTDAEHALATLPTLGAPDGSAVYFAVDTDASSTQIAKLVLPYFAAIRAVFGGNTAPNGYRTASKFRVGVYASGAVCNSALVADLVDLTWLAAPTGWLGSKEFLLGKKWVLHQGLPTKIAGVDCDPNTSNGSDWGQFVPFGAAQNIAAAQAQVALSVISSDKQLATVTDAIHAMVPALAQAVLSALKEN